MFRYLFYASLLFILAGTLTYLIKGKNDYPSDVNTLAKGKALFTRHCVSCHGLQEDGIGPPLGGVTNLLSENRLTNFIRNPAKVIETGDERAATLYASYKQIMPSFDWMNEMDINSILSYIHQQTALHQIKARVIDKDASGIGLSGRLVAPVKKSRLKIVMKEVVQLPRIKDTSPDLGIVTLRAHPSGDGTLFVSDQNGIIYRISEGKAEIFLDLRKYVRDFQSGPGIATGVGSFDFHPDFLNNGYIYITHAETFKGQVADYRISDSIKAEVQWVLAEWKMDNVNDKIFNGKHRELLRLHAPTFAHGCQDIAFIPGLDKNHPDYGLLYFGFGDGGSNNIKRPEFGHHLRSFLGAVMRVDPLGNNSKNGKYGIPDSNPFVHEKDPLTVREIYALGFRNPHRIAWDEANENRMMVTDIGEANVEELNIIEKGGDYGWPVREGNFGIATTKDMKTVYKLQQSDHDLYKKPFVQYDHQDGNAISGGYIYEGNLAPLKNKYVFGDIVNGKLFYVNIDPALSDSTVYELAIVHNGMETDLREMSNSKRLHLRIAYDRFKKELYVITKVDGKIRRIVNVR
jgi:glucose/arabinose dehydrogenase/mono/diheme cytochrome c family protein